MTTEPRLSFQTLKVLSAFVEAAPGELAGIEIASQAKLASGTLYPILRRLEGAGWLTSRWEELDPSEEKRPRRRYYKISALGFKRAQESFSEVGALSLVPSVAGGFAR